MTNKRYLVVYGVGAILLLAFAAAFLLVGKKKFSDMPREDTMATTSALAVTEEEAPPATPSVPDRKPFQFEIVTTQAAQAQGLSGRAEIPADYGMLFVFPEKAQQRFWMKDMLAPIDIIWVSNEAVVIDIEREVSPATYPNVFTSPEPVRYVLETRAGETRRLGIEVGTKLNFPAPYTR